MRKCLLALTTMLLTSPALADAPPPPWHGVWRGTVGTLPVMACLAQQSDSWSMGSYYYLSKMKPIGLEHEKDGSWTEHAEGGDKPTGKLTLSPASVGSLSGEWRSGARMLPVALTRVAVAPSDDGLCASNAYIAPRIRPVRLVTKPASASGFAYSQVTYDVGPSFPDVSIESFSYPPTMPGDRAINAAIRLDPARHGDLADYLDCMQNSLGSFGTDGDFQFTWSPGLATRQFLSVNVNANGSCGGAHPFVSHGHITFDRLSGRKINLSAWFSPAGIVPASSDDGGDEHQITPGLRRLVVSRFRFSETECREVVSTADYWDIGIGQHGIMFDPSLPHVAEACGDSVVVPFAALDKFLSPAGKQAIARLAGR